MKHSFTSSIEGNHQICFDNYNQKNKIRIDFEFSSGVAAKDYSELAKKEHLEPIELNLTKLEDMMRQLLNELSSIIKLESRNKNDHDQISHQIFVFSFLFFLVIIFLSYLEVAYVKRLFKHRKTV
jgi:hypothetical protein